MQRPHFRNQYPAIEPSPLDCLDDNRAKQSKAIIGLATMVALSALFYAAHHTRWEGLASGNQVQAHYAPVEDPNLHTELR